MALTVTGLDISRIRRKRYYYIRVYGTDFPAVPAGFAISITSNRTGQTLGVNDYLLYGPTQVNIYGTVPKEAPRGTFDLTITLGAETAILNNAFTVLK